MTSPEPQQPQPVMSRAAHQDSHAFRTRATRDGDILDIIKALEKRITRLEAQNNTH